MSMSLFRTATAICAVGLVAAATPASAAGSGFDSLFVFGDSLSDAQGGNSVPVAPNQGGLLIPAPYDDGRVSNGPVAAEYLGGLLGLSRAQQFQYAVAGARSGTTGEIPGVGTVLTGLKTQVGAFAAGGPNAAYGGGLFLVWAGANDLRDALVAAAAPGGGPSPIDSFAGILDNLQWSVSGLYALGARNFLLPNLPNLGLTPASQALGTQAMEGASGVTWLFNAAYAGAVQGWQASMADAQFYTYDTFNAHNQLFMAGGFSNLSNGCLVPVAGAAQAQSACSESFYVDDIHPTTSVHLVLAQGMAAAVPEPETLLMMAGGLLALLGVARRRQGGAADSAA